MRNRFSKKILRRFQLLISIITSDIVILFLLNVVAHSSHIMLLKC